MFGNTWAVAEGLAGDDGKVVRVSGVGARSRRYGLGRRWWTVAWLEHEPTEHEADRSNLGRGSWWQQPESFLVAKLRRWSTETWPALGRGRQDGGNAI
jgi:hypothetical protein